ncbi:MAG: DUF1080 domain-containing protein [Balneolaceae bacterium]|nr:DUF1080 domain-containing protein [Balneolaceae bacterium]
MLRFAFSILLFGMLFTSTAVAQQSGQAANNGEWIQLFNGENLDGWTPKFTGSKLGVNYNNTFRVEDGLLTVSYDDWGSFDGEFGHLFYEKPFSNYRLRVEYRFIGDQVTDGPDWAFRNNGLMIHGQSPETMGIDQEFPVSVEIQLLGGSNSGERTTANICTPGTHVVIEGELVTQHCINSSSQTYHGDQWVTAEIVVRGADIQHYINGNLVFEYTDPQLDPNDSNAQALMKNAEDKDKILTSGTISIQAESHPTQFRKIEVLPLEE